MYLLVLVRKKIVLRLLLSTTPYGRSSRGCWQRECCSAERPGRQGFPSSSSDRSDDHPLPVSLSWRRVVSAGPAQWAGRHGAPPGRHMFFTAHMRMSGRRQAPRLPACVCVWWTGGACCLLPAPFFLLLDSGKENFARDRQAGGGQDLVALTEKAPRPWPPPPLPTDHGPLLCAHKGCSYLFFFPCSGTGTFLARAVALRLHFVDACSLLCFLEREEKKKQVPTINLFFLLLLFCAGVTSFEVDLEKKKVVVIGDVTPYEVLASISKVKFAELWVAPQQPQAAIRCGKVPAGGVV